MRLSYLQREKLNLKTLSPLHIGGGEVLTKKEYIYDPIEKKIHFLDFIKLISYMKNNNLLHDLEAFFLNQQQRDFRLFLENKKIEKNEWSAFTAYSIDAGAILASNRTEGVAVFMKGPDGLPYIPGSSLKGALRTALAFELMRIHRLKNPRVFDYDLQNIENNNMRSFNREDNALNQKLFYKLQYVNTGNRNKKPDAINDFMKGIMISDSRPIPYEKMTLCAKYDKKPDGYMGSVLGYRESVVPETDIEFALTLDHSVLSAFGIDTAFIERALRNFSKAHNDHHENNYVQVTDEANIESRGAEIYVGGGTGYISKTLTYPLFSDYKRALKFTSELMKKRFAKGNHDRDLLEYKVSPHTQKMTKYKGLFYPVGRCEITFK